MGQVAAWLQPLVQMLPVRARMQCGACAAVHDTPNQLAGAGGPAPAVRSPRSLCAPAACDPR